MDHVLEKILNQYKVAVEKKDIARIEELSSLLHDEFFFEVESLIPSFVNSYKKFNEKSTSLIYRFDVKDNNLLIFKDSKIVKQTPLLKAEQLVHFLKEDDLSEDQELLATLLISNREDIFSLNLIIATAL